MLLRDGRVRTAAALAEELEVSVRTIHRDVAALQAAGVPLWTETGPGGGVRCLPGWSGGLEALTGDEVAVLSLAGAPDVLAGLGLGALAASAQLKVRSSLPPELRGRAVRLQERFHLDAPGWFHRPDEPPALGTVADAVWSDRRVDVTYRRRDRTVRRRLDPVGLVLKAGTSYLVAAHRGRPRTYRISRIEECHPRDEPVRRPEGFVLADWWRSASESFDESLLRARCRLELSPAAQRDLPRHVDPGAAGAALDAARPGRREGWVVVDLAVESQEVAAHQLLALGPGVEVLGPAPLRRRLARLATDVVALNRGG